MDWSKYLLDIIRSRVAKDTTMPIFMNADSQGNMQPLSNALILKNIDKYISELEKFSGNVCAIYHKFDEQLIGFIIAAFCCNVKILIRRTTMELNKEINDDIRYIIKYKNL